MSLTTNRFLRIDPQTGEIRVDSPGPMPNDSDGARFIRYEADVEAFNEGAVRRFSCIRDFITLHYCLTRRRDSELWRHVAAMALPEPLAFKLDVWRRNGVLHLYDEEGFDATSGLANHAGMDHWPERDDPRFAEIPHKRAVHALHGRRDGIAASVERMPAPHRAPQQVLRSC